MDKKAVKDQLDDVEQTLETILVGELPESVRVSVQLALDDIVDAINYVDE